MGDRCSIQLYCRKEHAPVFENLGFVTQEEGWDGVPGLVEMVDEEANYAHEDDMPQDIPYFGWHGDGFEYGAEAFACDGRRHLSVSLDKSGEIVVRVDKRGRPCRRELRTVRKFLALERRVKKALGLPAHKKKERQ